MKLIKLTETHYIIVDDSEIKEGDWIYNSEREPSILECVGKGSLRGWQKITHSTQPLDERGYWGKVMPLTLTIFEIKELIGEVDVEKNMWYERNVQNPYSSDSLLHTGFNKGFELGYRQALEDNKEKKYTEEDLRKTIEMAREEHCYADDLSGYYWSKEEIIQSLQPKTEWEVEIIDGKLKLK